jgi:hypothetical protein
VLKVAERTGRPEIIEEMDVELKNIIEDFDRAVNVEALRLAKETRKHSPSQTLQGSILSILCRAGAIVCAAQVCRCWL